MDLTRAQTGTLSTVGATFIHEYDDAEFFAAVITDVCRETYNGNLEPLTTLKNVLDGLDHVNDAETIEKKFREAMNPHVLNFG